jgi:hypothetical protein
MLKTKSIAQVISSAMLSFALAIQGGEVAQALRPVFLLKTQCANAGPGNWERYNLNVSIGRAVYTSLFYMGPGDQFASMTCKIRPDNYPPLFQTLRLGYGMRDIERSSPENVVNVYLDGQQAASRIVAPGRKEELLIDVSNVTNVAIETICSSKLQYCDRVYFFDATLERLPPSPSQSN